MPLGSRGCAGTSGPVVTEAGVCWAGSVLVPEVGVDEGSVSPMELGSPFMVAASPISLSTVMCQEVVEEEVEAMRQQRAAPPVAPERRARDESPVPGPGGTAPLCRTSSRVRARAAAAAARGASSSANPRGGEERVEAAGGAGALPPV